MVTHEDKLAHYADRCEGVLFLPCDLPGLTSREISALKAAFEDTDADIVVAEDESSFWHALCTVVHTGLLPEITKAIDDGKQSVRRLWKELGATPVRLDDPAAFFNVNTPDDLRRWKSTKRKIS